ncbi:unnamed protein product, partial [Prorocentrum cordatum]
VRGPAKMARASRARATTAASLLKTDAKEEKIFKSFYTLMNLLRGVFFDLTGQIATENAFRGAVPETVVKAFGVDHLWPLIGFAWHALLEKSLVSIEQQELKPCHFVFGNPGRSDWPNKVQISRDDIYATGTVRTFMDNVDAMLKSGMRVKQWDGLVEVIKAACMD